VETDYSSTMSDVTISEPVAIEEASASQDVQEITLVFEKSE
jgi:hypothetical protein